MLKFAEKANTGLNSKSLQFMFFVTEPKYFWNQMLNLWYRDKYAGFATQLLLKLLRRLVSESTFFVCFSG